MLDTLGGRQVNQPYNAARLYKLPGTIAAKRDQYDGIDTSIV
jgi:hypothetical protein